MLEERVRDAAVELLMADDGVYALKWQVIA
jgi:hypothetical protein